jgi:hypothetical protein
MPGDEFDKKPAGTPAEYAEQHRDSAVNGCGTPSSVGRQSSPIIVIFKNYHKGEPSVRVARRKDKAGKYGPLCDFVFPRGLYSSSPLSGYLV